MFCDDDIFQDNILPSWKRLEQLIRFRVFENPLIREDVTTPVLLLLDGLTAAERDQVLSEKSPSLCLLNQQKGLLAHLAKRSIC